MAAITAQAMADIREALQGISDPDRAIGLLLIEFYESMRELEQDEHRAGKQATAIVMAINDIKAVPLRTQTGPFRLDTRPR